MAEMARMAEVARVHADQCYQSGNYAPGCEGPRGENWNPIMAARVAGQAQREAEAAAAAAAAEAARKAKEAANRDCGPFGLGCAANDLANAYVGLGSAIVSAGASFVADPVGSIQANASAIAHTALMVASFAPPPINVAASLLDAGLYALEGDYVGAATALLGMVPGGRLAGIAAGALLKGGTKLASIGLKGLKAGGGALTKALGHVGGEVGGRLGSQADDALGALYRHPGPAGGKRLPMNMDSVQTVGQNHGLDISGMDITIRKDITGVAGMTNPDQSVVFARDAFASEEELARTIFHEGVHVGDLRSGLPYPTTPGQFATWEKRAYDLEEAWWKSH